MYQKNKFDLPFCGLTLKLYETGKKSPSYEYTASAAKSQLMCSLTKKLYSLSQVMEWYQTPQVQVYAKQGYSLKCGTKVQQAKETKYGADSEQVFCMYMVKPYKPNDVDGFKKVEVPPVQPMPQAIQQSQASVEVDKEMDDDLPPF
tara:strand:- start:777 stop:1214 length:438 start_codon:yes stop_codon:yes gene_type:complete